MAILIGDVAPDFEAETTAGPIRFHDYIEGSWVVLFSHPKNYTPVCTTELGYTAKLKPEFDKRGVKVLGLSVDELSNHEGWSRDIEETQGARRGRDHRAGGQRRSGQGQVPSRLEDAQALSARRGAAAGLNERRGGRPPPCPLPATSAAGRAAACG
jgi:hypothetical protein